MKATEIKSTDDLLKKWLIRSHVNIQTHYRAANCFTNLNYWVGIPLILAVILLGSDVLSILTPTSEIERVARIMIGFIATMLAAFQTLFRFEERRNRHQLAAQRYGEAARRLEMLRSGTGQVTEQELFSLEQLINTTVRESVVPPSKIFDQENDKAKVTYGSTNEISE